MSLTAAESLAESVADGTYVPTAVDQCDAAFTLDRSPQFIRFTEFVLFAGRAGAPIDEPRYLVAQPQVLAELPDEDQRALLDRHVRPAVARAVRALPTSRLPAPDAERVDDIRQALRELVGESERDDAIARRSRTGPTAAARLRNPPALDLPDDELRDAYRRWLAHEEGRLIRSRFEPLLRLGLAPGLAEPGLAGDVDEVVARIGELFFPGPFQPFHAPQAHIALCASFEQEWQLVGYTRGELVSSLSLAPGERLTLEFHSWDKSSRKTEDELATESEVRTSEKLTQRDALTVAQELARQSSASMNINAVVPIPKMPLSIGGNTASQTSQSLRRTSESVRERTVEASNALRVNRKVKIEIAREVGREQRQTRVIENTNRCHALNCHHFEVVANHRVTTRLVSVRPCLLLANPRPAFTPEWVLCHEDVLVASLLDDTFMPGFDAARVLMTNAALERLSAERAAAALEQAGADVAPYVTALVGAFAGLTDAREASAAALDECGSHWTAIPCIAANVGEADLERTVTWFALGAGVQAGLVRLSADHQAGENPALSLRRYLTATAASDVAPGVPRETLRSRLLDFGFPALFVDAALLDDDPATIDDAGLRAADATVRALAASLPRDDAAAEDALPVRELADAVVAFEQLRCHLEDNWLHYMQAVWMREDHGQRFLRLQSLGAVATAIENELLGFHGEKAAYPLRSNRELQRVLDLGDILAEAEKLIAADPPPAMLVTLPTAGTVLEAITGECDACEDFIRESRVLDLRAQRAGARQAEAEAERLEQRVAQGDLSDPHPDPGRLVVEVRNVDDASPGG